MLGRRASLYILVLSLVTTALPAWVAGQSMGMAGVVKGTVKDPSGAVIPGATVTIYNPVTSFERTTSTDASGSFTFNNVPFNPYHLTVTATGFASHVQGVDLNSSVPTSLNIALQVSGGKTTVTVSTGASDLVEVDPTAHTDVDRALFDKLPLESASSTLSSLVTLSSPGVAADSNGLFHGFGDHASNSFSIDGQPITDQQSKVFSNQLPADAVQSLEVIQGAPPAEYGGKTSLVIVATTRSGMGETTPHGGVTASYGTFGTSNEAFNLGYGGKNWGNFIAGNGLNTTRFLDGPEFNVMHDRGNEQNIFDRFDFKPGQKDTVNLNFQYTRSWFQTPNSYDAQDDTAWNGLVVSNGGLGPNGLLVGSSDQRSLINTFNIAPAWTRLINNNTVFTLGGWARRDGYTYTPSRDPFADLIPDLQLQTIGQSRSLLNAGGRADVAYVKGVNNIKAGVVFQHTFLTEDDGFGVVDPTANAPCLNADGSPYTNPGLTDPANCTGTLEANAGQGSVPAFIPILGCYDLTRTATFPASDGCANSTAACTLIASTPTSRNWPFSPKTRLPYATGSSTSGCGAICTVAFPISARRSRVSGVAYNIKKTGTVLRASYARTMETPFNENLILASNGCTDPVINALMSSTISPCVSNVPLTPGTRNEFHAGLSKPSANTWWWMANTSGSIRRGVSTSASWVIHPSHFRWSGPSRRFRDLPCASACRTPMASPPTP